MANVLIERNTMVAIAQAIRSKNGETTTYKPAEMPKAILALKGNSLDDQYVVITGDCSNKFTSSDKNWFIGEYAQYIETVDVSKAYQMFYNNTLSTIPFDINIIDSCVVTNIFKNAKITQAPNIVGNLSVDAADCTNGGMFYNCYMLEYIPLNFFRNFASDEYWALQPFALDHLFYNCYRLRALPDISMMTNTSGQSQDNWYTFYQCYSLDEIIDCPFIHCCDYTFEKCSRVKDITFSVPESETGINSDGLRLYLNKYVGYASQSLTSFGFTTDTQVTDAATYSALKNNNDYWTTDVAYSRYNHDSAVNTINSLPQVVFNDDYVDNMIIFEAASGSATDGGAIENLTEEEVAVATYKGWTVALY